MLAETTVYVLNYLNSGLTPNTQHDPRTYLIADNANLLQACMH